MSLENQIAKSSEQFYMLEVFVDQVNFEWNGESAVNSEDLAICIKFTDLPEYKLDCPGMNQGIRENSEPAESSIDFKFGKSCLFAKTPETLIKAMKGSPLIIEVYYKVCSNEINDPLLGSAKMSFPDYMYNQVAIAEKAVDGLSTPLMAKDTFDLKDSNGRKSGSISVILRLSCFGSSVVKHFSIKGKSFVLEDTPLEKFLCPYLPAEDTMKDKYSTCGNAKPLLKRPNSPPRLTITDPGFKYLTSAEKLNDPKYREIVYRAYPDEPTCSCMPTDRATHPMKCRSGCDRPCCMKLRNPDILSTQDRTIEDTWANTYCVSNFLGALSALKNNPPCGNANRLRGGGDVEQIYIDPAGYKWADYDMDFAMYDDRINIETRLEGGGCGEKEESTCSCSGGAVPVPFRKAMSKEEDVGAVFDACKPRVTSTGPKPGCTCPGKGARDWQQGSAKCMKSPCMGIDCLIRAFKEAQEFVDSIGRVPGLPGLGLMDPSESPYFGRDIDRDYVPQEPQMEPNRKLGGSPHQASCKGPCNAQMGKSGDDAGGFAPMSYAPPVPMGVNIPPRLGIVREAIPVLPEAGSTRQKRKDEKTDKHKEHESPPPALPEIEIGPCGEPRCKSKRKGAAAEIASMSQSAMQIASKAKAVRKSSTSRTRRSKGRSINSRPGHSKPSKGHRKGGKAGAAEGSAPGPGGDRTPTSKPSITVNRRVMRYVYYAGDTYPGINYGHRNCIDIRMRVPANMGWLWNTLATYGNLKPRLGWKPGAIARYVYELLQDAKEESMEDELMLGVSESQRGRGRGAAQRAPLQKGAQKGKRTGSPDRSSAKSAPGRRGKSPRRNRAGATSSFPSMHHNGEDEEAESHPTLHIHRKDGIYYVTMYPIKQEPPGEPRVTEPMKPLQFKIVKNKDEGSAASSSTASDMEIEFSPPAAITRQRKKPDVIHVDTQVRQQEILDAIKERTTRKSRREKRSSK